MKCREVRVGVRKGSSSGFPFGITEKNILERQAPRNRRIADIFSKCGLVERSGQGMNLMFETSIKTGKHVPDFRGTDKLHVNLTLDGQIQDEALLRMMEEIGNETLSTFTTHDFLLVDMVRREKTISEDLRDRLRRLVDLGIIEKASRGRYILGKRYYYRIGSKGKYTRKRGLDRETKKQLLLKHIREAGKEGCKLRELCEVLPAENRSQIQVFLRELRNNGKINVVGTTNAARWYFCNQ